MSASRCPYTYVTNADAAADAEQLINDVHRSYILRLQRSLSVNNSQRPHTTRNDDTNNNDNHNDKVAYIINTFIRQKITNGHTDRRTDVYG